MTTASPPKKLRRWKRWAAMALASVALMATWWDWPREDPRFCGEWRVVDDLTGSSTGTFRLSRNGRGSSFPAGTSDQWMFRWTRDGDQLVIGKAMSQSFRDQLEWITERFLRVTGWSFLTVEVRAEVLEVEPDRIRLREVKPSGGRITLERIGR
jgi:hypothetical protein